MPHWLTAERRISEARKKPGDRKRGKRSRRKGKRGEDELAALMSELTGEAWERRSGSRDVIPRDVNSEWSDHHVEGKRRKRIGAMRWQEQAEKDGAAHGKRRRIVAWREDAPPGGKKPAWVVQVALTEYVSDQLELYRYRSLYGPLGSS